MRIYFLTLFPEALTSYFSTSMMKRAIELEALDLHIINIADFSVRNTRRVDDRPYGGLPGTLLAPEPCEKAIQFANSKEAALGSKATKIHWITPDPRGEVLAQKKLSHFAKSEGALGILCGHYEGIDERVLEYFQIEKISLGEYILTGGELAAGVIIDGVIRLIPGVLSEESLQEESFSAGLDGKKEYPQYTRPENWNGLSVPRELISGNHKAIEEWKNTHTTPLGTPSLQKPPK